MIYNSLAYFRRQEGMSIKDIASLVNHDKKIYRTWETTMQRPPEVVLQALAQCYGVTICQLLSPPSEIIACKKNKIEKTIKPKKGEKKMNLKITERRNEIFRIVEDSGHTGISATEIAEKMGIIPQIIYNDMSRNLTLRGIVKTDKRFYLRKFLSAPVIRKGQGKGSGKFLSIEKIKIFMQKIGLYSCSELGRAIGMKKPKMVYKWFDLKSSPSPHYLNKLCDLFHCQEIDICVSGVIEPKNAVNYTPKTAVSIEKMETTAKNTFLNGFSTFGTAKILMNRMENMPLRPFAKLVGVTYKHLISMRDQYKRGITSVEENEILKNIPRLQEYLNFDPSSIRALRRDLNGRGGRFSRKKLAAELCTFDPVESISKLRGARLCEGFIASMEAGKPTGFDVLIYYDLLKRFVDSKIEIPTAQEPAKEQTQIVQQEKPAAPKSNRVFKFKSGEVVPLDELPAYLVKCDMGKIYSMIEE